MSIEDAHQDHEMQMQIYAQNMQDAEDQRKRDEIKMIQDRHPKNPFDDVGATVALLSRDTSPAVQLIQSAIES